MKNKIPKCHPDNGKYHFLFPRTKIIYSHIPRGGGTWFKRFLYINEHGVEEESIRLKEGAVHSLKYDRVHIKDFADYKDCFKFTMLRDPLDRMISAYRRFLRDGLGHWAKAWDCDENTTIQEFAERVCNTEDKEADVHLVSQYGLVIWEGESPHNYIGLYENFNKVIDDIVKKTGIKKLNNNNRVNNSQKQENLIITADIKEKVFNRYEKDYELIKIIKENGGVLWQD